MAAANDSREPTGAIISKSLIILYLKILISADKGRNNKKKSKINL